MLAAPAYDGKDQILEVRHPVSGKGCFLIWSSSRCRSAASFHESVVGREGAIAQTAVCNRHHSVDRQLCRWLLSCECYAVVKRETDRLLPNLN